MTSTPRRHPRRASGFSLIEILVVIGILVALIGFTVMYLSKARRQASRTRQAYDFQAIATALNEFKNDHGDYPRVGTGEHGLAFALLGRALVGAGPATFDLASPQTLAVSSKHYEAGEIAVQSGEAYVAIADNENGTAPTGNSQDDFWSKTPYADNADGPGFKLRSSGRTFGPYLAADKFKVRGFALLDIWGNPILYFPARAGSINVNRPDTIPAGHGPAFVWDTRDITTYPQSLKPLFDVTDNLGMLNGKFSVPATDTTNNRPARQTLQKMLGDNDMDGWINAGDTANTTGPYVLWSAGPDAEGNHEFIYGPIDATGKRDLTNGKTDDVLNFDLPTGLLKK